MGRLLDLARNAMIESAERLLITLCGKGIRIRIEGDDLIVRPKRLITDEIRSEIKSHKPYLIRVIRREIGNFELEKNPQLRQEWETPTNQTMQ